MKNKFIYINCFQLKKAKDIYVQIFRGLTQEENP